MSPGMQQRLQSLIDRHAEVASLLSDPAVISDQAQFRDLSREYARLEAVARDYRDYEQALADRSDAEQLAAENDPQLRELVSAELEAATARLADLERALRRHLVPSDPLDEKNIYLEVRAGTGGDEAALFAGDLFRMYSRYAEARGFGVEIMSASPGEHGGYKEVIAHVTGRGAYATFKFESGAHRVQRVPETESQGRIHTSACTVAVLPEAAEIDEIDIRDEDVRVDTYRASGAGGQHVNKTDSAVRLTHLPSGIVVECQDERSQHKNRDRAWALLHARLLAAERERRESARAAARRTLVGSGDRSERIRTYNFPQGRVTDHRINLTLYKLDDILAGNLEPIVEPLQAEYQAEQLAGLED